MKLIYTLLLTALFALSSHAFGLGVQMYSLQEKFDRDTPGTLDRLKAQGFTDLETSVFTKLPVAELRASLQARGMTCSSHHVRPETLEKNMDQVIADAKALGAFHVVCASLPHKAPLDRAQVLKAAANFNRYGRRCGESCGPAICVPQSCRRFHGHAFASGSGRNVL